MRTWPLLLIICSMTLNVAAASWPETAVRSSWKPAASRFALAHVTTLPMRLSASGPSDAFVCAMLGAWLASYCASWPSKSLNFSLLT